MGESNSITTTRLIQDQQKQQQRRSYSQKQEQEQKQNKQNQDDFRKVVENKIDIVMKDIPGCNWIKKSLLDRKIISLQNANTICDYVLACKSEDSISTNTRRNILTTLTTFLKWTSKNYYKTTSVPFSDMTRDTIKLYFDSLQKPDTEDPTHKWKGTYNMKVPALQKFYRWLYSSPNTILPQIKQEEDYHHCPIKLVGLKC